jgi:hypothetical protein
MIKQNTQNISTKIDEILKILNDTTIKHKTAPISSIIVEIIDRAPDRFTAMHYESCMRCFMIIIRILQKQKSLLNKNNCAALIKHFYDLDVLEDAFSYFKTENIVTQKYFDLVIKLTEQIDRYVAKGTAFTLSYLHKYKLLTQENEALVLASSNYLQHAPDMFRFQNKAVFTQYVLNFTMQKLVQYSKDIVGKNCSLPPELQFVNCIANCEDLLAKIFLSLGNQCKKNPILNQVNSDFIMQNLQYVKEILQAIHYMEAAGNLTEQKFALIRQNAAYLEGIGLTFSHLMRGAITTSDTFDLVIKYAPQAKKIGMTLSTITRKILNPDLLDLLINNMEHCADIGKTYVLLNNAQPLDDGWRLFIKKNISCITHIANTLENLQKNKQLNPQNLSLILASLSCESTVKIDTSMILLPNTATAQSESTSPQETAEQNCASSTDGDAAQKTTQATPDLQFFAPMTNIAPNFAQKRPKTAEDKIESDNDNDAPPYKKQTT